MYRYFQPLKENVIILYLTKIMSTAKRVHLIKIQYIKVLIFSMT